MTRIHPTAVVDPAAELAEGVDIGPYCFVEAGVVIGRETRLESHVTVRGGTTIGERNVFAQGSVIGGDPQDRKWAGEPTYLNIGHDNVFREYVTIHRATGEGNATVVGDRNYLMAFVHLGHNVTIHNDVTMANSVGVSGHVTVEDLVNIGGMTGVHQFVRIGRVAMVGGMSRIVRDVPPFMLVEGLEQTVHDINAVGLRRIGVTQEARLALHKACKLLFKSKLGLSDAMEVVRREVRPTPEIDYLLWFLERLFRGKNGRGDQNLEPHPPPPLAGRASQLQ
ncbi:MAG: acyl-ACP--UDP-N-acetylglucosamine O-acyltransferase [Fimbriimonadaceae bacterium]|nr:acyl-ACP--UDP-N-acetylglucosamine O-acyltransferase [Fimbriimonadaceae bacterium]QYK56163.1 MAG: acyl-ACP--UDP-N-acetylglucosamine O-acyltransferase [Fimbriimonadaceae bacterium]